MSLLVASLVTQSVGCFLAAVGTGFPLAAVAIARDDARFLIGLGGSRPAGGDRG